MTTKNAQRLSIYKERMKQAGFKRLSVYVSPELAERLKAERAPHECGGRVLERLILGEAKRRPHFPYGDEEFSARIAHACEGGNIPVKKRGKKEIVTENSEEIAKEKRRRLREHYLAHSQMEANWELRGYSYPPPSYPAFPEDLRGLRCGAKTRAGTACKQPAAYVCGRCKLHGGMSTGPKTEAGRRQSAENGKKGGRPKKQKPTP